MYSISGNGMFLKLSVRWTYDLVTPAAFSHFAFERNSLKFLSLRRKPLFRYCYECGRSVGVRLTPCSRCHEVYFCSRACKLKSWDDRHKDECLRVRGKIRSSLRWIVMPDNTRAWTHSRPNTGAARYAADFLTNFMTRNAKWVESAQNLVMVIPLLILYHNNTKESGSRKDARKLSSSCKLFV